LQGIQRRQRIYGSAGRIRQGPRHVAGRLGEGSEIADSMTHPDAIKKHDGRLVAFDCARLAASIARAALAANVALTQDSANRLGDEIARAVGSFLVSEGPA